LQQLLVNKGFQPILQLRPFSNSKRQAHLKQEEFKSKQTMNKWWGLTTNEINILFLIRTGPGATVTGGQMQPQDL